MVFRSSHSNTPISLRDDSEGLRVVVVGWMKVSESREILKHAGFPLSRDAAWILRIKVSEIGDGVASLEVDSEMPIWPQAR